MSNEYTCDDCEHAREATDEEVAYGTHYCKVKKEFVQCYINCNDWKGDSEEERQLKLKEKVNKWWHEQEENYKYELMEGYYPDDAYLMEVDEMWNGLDWNDKWEIYRREKDEVYI